MEMTAQILNKTNFPSLLAELKQRGYKVLGPTVRDKAIMYDELYDVDDLPAGWVDEQDGGSYRLSKGDSGALFGYVIGPDSWKKYLYPARQKIFDCSVKDGTLTIYDDEAEQAPMAFVGMRACELHAVAIQDKVFLNSHFTDPGYARRRKQAFFVAVNCTKAANTCFCTSMNTGPKVDLPVDLNLTELVNGDRHEFLIESGSEKGAEVLAALPTSDAPKAAITDAATRVKAAAGQMGRSMDTKGLKELIYDNLEHPVWEAVASRCLGCTNCTMTCPTCFCTTVEDTTDIAGTTATRTRCWDSCFTWDFSYMHGASIRQSGRSRYRQWMSHKLASWQDQFDTIGCVGCGRCITWCPVGIDITEEVKNIRNSKQAEAENGDN